MTSKKIRVVKFEKIYEYINIFVIYKNKGMILYFG